MRVSMVHCIVEKESADHHCLAKMIENSILVHASETQDKFVGISGCREHPFEHSAQFGYWAIFDQCLGASVR